MRFSSLFRPLYARLTALPALSLLAALAAAAWAPCHAQTLVQALASAYHANPDLSGQRAGLRALNEGVNDALAGWRPSVSVIAGPTRRIGTLTPLRGDDVNHAYTTKEVRIVASQPLWNGIAGPKVEAAEARVLQGRADLLQREQGVLLAAAKAYLDVLQNRELVKLNQANERALAQQVEYRRQHFERQLGTRTELAQAQARHAAALAQFRRAENQLAISQGTFRRTIGIAPGELTVPHSLPPIPDRLDTILTIAAHDAPSVRSAYYGVQAARADVDTASGSLKPSVNMEAAGAWSREPGVGLHRQHDASLQVTVRIPLYQGGAEWSGLRGSRERQAQTQALLESAQLDIRQEAVDAWNNLLAARAEIDAFGAAVAANEVAYEGVRSQYEVLGELSLIEVLNARQELFTAQVTLVQARVQAALSQLRLLAAQGLLTAEHLQLPVALYRPEDDYRDTRGRWVGTN